MNATRTAAKDGSISGRIAKNFVSKGRRIAAKDKKFASSDRKIVRKTEKNFVSKDRRSGTKGTMSITTDLRFSISCHDIVGGHGRSRPATSGRSGIGSERQQEGGLGGADFVFEHETV